MDKKGERLNILILVKDSMIGGVVSCSSTLAQGLMSERDSVVIGSTNGSGIDQFYISGSDVEIIDFNGILPHRIIRNYIQISRIVKKYKVNIIHCQNRIPSLYAALFCKFHKEVKYVWSNHLVPLSNSLFSRMITHYGSAAIAEGIDGKEMLVSLFNIPESKVCVINLGTDISHFSKTTREEQAELKRYLNIREKDKVILLYGRLAEVKGHLFLLDALKSVNSKQFVLIFPGQNDDYKRKILEKAKQYGIESKILFPGYIDGRQYLSICDLMILPSKQEGFGIVNVEAFCMEVPVIRTTTAGYKDMEDCCFGVNYGDTNALTELLNDFFEGDPKFKDKAKYAKTQVARFSLENMTRKHRELYHRILMED